MQAPQRFDVLGVRVAAITMHEVIEALEQMVQSKGKGYFVFCTEQQALLV